MVSTDDLIGKGIVFPFQFDEKGSIVITTGFDLLKASMQTIVNFFIGTRYFLGEFGVNPVDLLEEPNDDVSASLLLYRLQNQIPLWDKRISIIDVKLDRPDRDTLNVMVDIQLNGTNIQDTFIFPFLTSTVT
jgi:phage baseplate assembly protein W